MALAATKKVRTLRNMAIAGAHVEVGSVVEISAEDATSLLNLKAVEAVDDKVALYNAPEPDAIAAQAAAASKSK